MQEKTILTKTQPYDYNQAIWTNVPDCACMIYPEQVFAQRKKYSLKNTIIHVSMDNISYPNWGCLA